jgi:ABC-2 type transport system ATP-binding protein
MITVSHITKRFGGVHAVNDVSFSIQQGEVVGLLGPNGAGKTTTMRLMTGYYVPDQGTVEIGEVSVNDDPVTARAQVGYLPESNPLYRDMLVSEFLVFTARLKGVARHDYRAAFDRVVADTGIDEVFYRPLSELSKGYRQRVGLASALMGDPSTLILDEPTEGLDPNQRHDLRELLTRLATNKTILWSTHVISEIRSIADRIIVLRKGEVAAIGTVDELVGASSGGRFTVELEGKGVEKALRTLSSVTQSTVTKQTGDRYELSVVTNDPDTFPRALSKLAAAHAYVMWRVTPEEGGLERAFAELTLGGEEATERPFIASTK